jgi:hypothetical protein
MGSYVNIPRPNERAIRREILLKNLTVKELRFQIESLRFRISLQRMEKRLKKQLTEDFNPVLSLQVDALQFLMNSLDEKSHPQGHNEETVGHDQS